MFLVLYGERVLQLTSEIHDSIQYSSLYTNT